MQLALDSAKLLRPQNSLEDRALWGLLQLAVTLSYAKMGNDGNAWNYWDQTYTAARSLTDGYAHPYTLFGINIVEAYAIAMNADLLRGRWAARQADRLNIDTLPSATQRSFHLLATARVYQRRRARSIVLELAQRGGATIRAEVDDLSRKLPGRVVTSMVWSGAEGGSTAPCAERLGVWSGLGPLPSWDGTAHKRQRSGRRARFLSAHP